MPNIVTKLDFIEQLKKYTKIHNNINIIDSFEDNKIVVEETEESGAGKIYLDISSYSSEIFFLKILHQPKHNIGIQNNHNDGIVLKINLNTTKIVVFLFELKKQLRFNKLEKAIIQLASAFRFVKYLMLEECFDVEYKFYIAYEINNINLDGDVVKLSENTFKFKLFQSVYENKSTIPIQIPFCNFQTFNFNQVQFGATIQI